MLFDTALTLARDLLKFLEEKGEDKAAEDQHKVISALQDAKLQNYKNKALYMTLFTSLSHNK